MEFSDHMLEEREGDKSRLSLALLRLFEVHRPMVAMTVVIIRLAAVGSGAKASRSNVPSPHFCTVQMVL